MAIEHIGPAGQRFVDRRVQYDLNHNLALIKVAPDETGKLPTPEEFHAQIASRLHFMPRLRRRLVFPPGGIGPPYLADDPGFELDYHVNIIDGERISDHRAHQILGAMLERPLARNRPLWEVWLIYGLEDGTMAVVAKGHHLVLDGVLGWQTMAAVLLDVSPDGMDVQPEPWDPPPLPDRLAAARESLGNRLRRLRAIVSQLIRALRDPEARGQELEGLRALRRTLREELWPNAPDLPINRPVGMHRQATWVTVSMHDVKAVAHAAKPHATVNDVILAIVSEGLRAQLKAMAHPEPMDAVRVMVPISVMRRTGGRVTFDQRDAFMVLDLDVDEADIAKRLSRICVETPERKGSEAGVIEGLLELVLSLPAPGRDRAFNLIAGARMHNVLLSNIQGVDHALYLRGHEVQAVAALAGLPEGHGLRIVAISAQDHLTFGITVDPNVIPDHEPLKRGITEGLAKLVASVAEPSKD